MLKETVEMVRINHQSVFDLLDMPFYQEDFCFFPELALALGEAAQATPEQASKIGILSEIIHLSSKIHLMIAEETPTVQAERQQMQLPILVGDLLYGRFIHYLTAHDLEQYLPLYLQYLKNLNSCAANSLREQTVWQENKFAHQTQMLAAVTAEVFALICGEEKQQLLAAKAEQMVAERLSTWMEKKIMSLAELQSIAETEKI